MEVKTICILAKSVKHGDSCIAGIELDRENGRWINTGRWIRPVSTRAGGAISTELATLYKTETTPNLFDIVDIALDAPTPTMAQPENWIVNNELKWEFRGRFHPIKAIDSFLETPDDLWHEHNQYADRASESWVNENRLPSLYFIKPESAYVYLKEYHNGCCTSLKRRIVFEYNSIEYDLAVTDPAMETNYFAPMRQKHANGAREMVKLDCKALCVSLTPVLHTPHSSNHFKVAATVLHEGKYDNNLALKTHSTSSSADDNRTSIAI